MGKKKNKNKLSGAVKTAVKTEKKFANKRKKELANLGEEDIAYVVAQIEIEEAKRLAPKEKSLPGPPSPRAYATLTPHPTSNELILFGGEYHDGRKTLVYNELLLYNPSSNVWRRVQAPGAPPPRSAHQAIATPANKYRLTSGGDDSRMQTKRGGAAGVCGAAATAWAVVAGRMDSGILDHWTKLHLNNVGELWIFGGEFTSLSETQFHHYKDLWCFSLAENKWEKITANGGPSARSGHRMVLLGRQLVVFGGYTDDGRECRYFDDLHVFCLDARAWSRPTPSRSPAPRSACLMLPAPNDSVVVYGGFSRVREGRAERGCTHADMWRLSRRAGAWQWRALPPAALAPLPRAQLAAAANAPAARAYVFGGVTDLEETEEELRGEMSGELLMLDLEAGRWHNVTLRTDPPPHAAPSPAPAPSTADQTLTVVTDEVFTMRLCAPAAPAAAPPAQAPARPAPSSRGPGPRMSAMMAVQRSVLYIYGGVLEKDDKIFCLSDMYSLDLHKLGGWRVLAEQPPLPEWLGSDSDSGSSSDADSDGSDACSSDHGEY